MWDDLLVNGTSLLTFGEIEDFSGVATTPPLRGSNLVIPGVAGEQHVDKVRDAYNFMVPLAIVGTDHGDRIDRILDLEALLNSATTALTLTRRLTRGVSQISQTAQGDYVSGLEPAFLGLTAARVPLVLRNLSGGWT